MTTRRTTPWGRAIIVLIALTAVVGFGWRVWRTRPAPSPVQAPAATRAGTVRLDATAQANAGLEIVAVTKREQRDRIEAPGVLALDETRTARIGSVVEGKVLNVFAGVGDRVTEGQVLADLHSRVIHETWAAYRKAVAERKRAGTELNYAMQAHQRAQRLYNDKAISLQEVQRALADRQAAEQNLDMAATEVRRSEEALEHLGITSGEDPSGERGEQIPVRTPLTGAVLERSVTAGTAVTPGMGLFVISDLSTLWALAEIDETKLPRVRVGLPVEVRVAAYPDESFAGSVIFVADTLDPKTRRITVRCRVPNTDGRLKPQMFATIALGDSAARQLIAVPAAALQELDGRPAVFVVEADGAFQQRPVTTGTEMDGWVEIVGGLSPGERVVAAGSFLLKSELQKSSAPED